MGGGYLHLLQRALVISVQIPAYLKLVHISVPEGNSEGVVKQSLQENMILGGRSSKHDFAMTGIWLTLSYQDDHLSSV